MPRVGRSAQPAQGYRLTLAPTGISIESADPAGEFYARRTLAQIQAQCPTTLPALHIEDHPDFPVRGVMLDISRDKVPTMATLRALIDQLASWKINQLQLYTEHTFAYSQHPVVWEHASPLTAAEIRELDAYCKERFIELVPNQNSLGHMERWLKHPAYRQLAESIDGAQTPWGFRWPGPFSLCPTDPGSLTFLAELYAELLPNFGSRLFNVGLDETFDIGQGRSKPRADEIGSTRVYLEFLKQVHALVRSHGRTMQFWGDIIVHKPELIAELPEDAIALEWGYEADHPFDAHGAAFAAAGAAWYVCPGTCSWNSFAGRTDNAIANLRSAAEAGLRHGASGYLITDWGDNGHLQPLPVSYLGLAAGAAFSWCLESNREIDLVAALNSHAFEDATGTLGRVAFDLGNVYRTCRHPGVNGSTLFRAVIPSPSNPHPERDLGEADLLAAEAAVQTAAAPLASFTPATAEQRLVAEEWAHVATLLRHAIAVARRKLELPRGDAPDLSAIIAEHRRLWLARNRPGGLDDSVARLTPRGGPGWI